MSDEKDDCRSSAEIAEELSQLLTQEEVAKIIGVSPLTLQQWRSRKRYDLPYVKIGRLVRYKKQDVRNYIYRNTKKHIRKFYAENTSERDT